jgi:hypothetical protein
MKLQRSLPEWPQGDVETDSDLMKTFRRQICGDTDAASLDISKW